MKKLLLIQILKSFSKNEFAQFDEFIRSPFYNKKPNVIKVFEILRKNAPDFSEDRIQKEVFWKQLYPEKNYNWGVLKNLIADITGLLEKFIEVIRYENKTLEKSFNFIDALSERKIHNKFFTEYNSLHGKISKSKYYEGSFSDMQKLLMKKITHCSVNSSFESQIRDEMIDISDYQIYDVIINMSASYAFNAVYSSDKNLQTENNIYNNFFSNESVINFITRSDKLAAKNKNILMLYYFQYKTYSSLEKTNYLKFKKYLYENSDLFSAEIKSLLFHSLGDTYNLIPSGKDDDKILEFLNIYKKQIEENVFVDQDGVMRAVTYSNILKMAIRVFDHKIIKFARDNFFELLLPELKENMNYYTEAHYHYAKGDFEKALEYCIKLKTDHFMFKYDIKDLMGMIYYELGEYENFLYHLDSYLHFLKKNKSVSPLYKGNYSRYIKNIHKLFKIRMENDEYGLQLFEKDIADGKIGSKCWFKLKISEIKSLKNKK